MPTRGRLRKGVGISICLAKGVSPRDLSRGRMFCWRRQKKTMILFMGFNASASPGGQNLKNGRCYDTPQGRQHDPTSAFLLIPVHSKGSCVKTGGRVERHCEGEGVTSDLLSRESKQRVTWNFSLFVFFRFQKNWWEPDVWTP
jgi:hypothetical protein